MKLSRYCDNPLSLAEPSCNGQLHFLEWRLQSLELILHFELIKPFYSPSNNPMTAAGDFRRPYAFSMPSPTVGHLIRLQFNTSQRIPHLSGKCKKLTHGRSVQVNLELMKFVWIKSPLLYYLSKLVKYSKRLLVIPAVSSYPS